MKTLDAKTRLLRALEFEGVDRLPSIGGWIGGARVLAALASIAPSRYMDDPLGCVVKAHSALQIDGMIGPIVPASLDQVRTGSVLDESFEGVEPEDLAAFAEDVPEPSAVRRAFDWEGEERELRRHFSDAEACWNGLVPLPNFWDIGGHFPLYTRFGYEAFLSACALYPDSVGCIWASKSEHSRCRAEILAKLYKELDLVPVMFCGEDLCNNQGPMVDPGFLRRHYFPTVRRSIEPLVNAGVKLIHHCDGDISALVQDYLDLGFSGLQGFQYELGVSIAELRRLKTPFGHPPIIWAGMSVSTTLPFGSPDDVRAEIDGFVRDTEGRGLFVFTSNVTGVEVPPENIRAGYLHCAERRTA